MTSLTQRSSGLVQRRTEASRNAADKERAAGGGGGSGEDEAQSRRDEQDDDDKGDSKETRLTLMEEVLLLGLKDREVRARRAGRGGGGGAGPRWLQVGAGRGLTCPWLRSPATLIALLVPRNVGVSPSPAGPCVFQILPVPSAWGFSFLCSQALLVPKSWQSLLFFFAFSH